MLTIECLLFRKSIDFYVDGSKTFFYLWTAVVALACFYNILSIVVKTLKWNFFF